MSSVTWERIVRRRGPNAVYRSSGVMSRYCQTWDERGSTVHNWENE